MDKQKCRDMAEDVLLMIQKIEEDYGVKVAYKGGGFDATSATLKFEFAEVNEDGTAESPERKYLKDIYPNWVGKEFTIENDTFKIIGWRPRATKRPVVCIDSNGRRYIFPEPVVRQLLGN